MFEALVADLKLLAAAVPPAAVPPAAVPPIGLVGGVCAAIRPVTKFLLKK
jgi:hypothetical protein